MTQQTCCTNTLFFSDADSQFFKALSDPARLHVLACFSEKTPARTVTQVAECCPQSLSVISRHLKMLKDAGILTSSKSGKEVTYRVATTAVADRLRSIATALENCC